MSLVRLAPTSSLPVYLSNVCLRGYELFRIAGSDADFEQYNNHPCIMAWVVFNESWGIEQICGSESQQDFVRRVSRLTRELNIIRLVIDNDGWEHQGGESDLLTIHDYTAGGA
jgi:hypothetical protein